MFVSGLWMYFRNFARSKVQSAPERACRRSLGHEEGLAIASLPLRESAAEASAWSQANQDSEVVGHHRGPDIGLEVVEPAPGAAGQAVGPLEAGDAGLDPGPEVAQLAIDPAAADHVFDAEAALLVKGHVAHPARLRAIQVLAAGKNAPRPPPRDPGLGGGQTPPPPPPEAAPRRKRRCGAPTWARAVRCRPGCPLR